ncbi:MAG: phosphate ABC transporter permease subunit PstC [Sumerlaeia bacterium]
MLVPQQTPPSAPNEGAARLSKPRPRPLEWVIEKWLWFAAASSIFITFAIIYVLVTNSALFFKEVSFFEFITGTNWSPLFKPAEYGILPLLAGTSLIVVIAAIIALPIGLGCAVYMSEYATPFQRMVFKPFLEILAGIPTIVYGYLALTFITPILQSIYPGFGVFNALSGGIVVGIMILPMIATLSEDALRAVPKNLREGAYGLGAQSYQVSLNVVLPAGLSGISSAFILALSRAFGETMAVTIAAGSTPKLTLDPTQSIQTMTSYIVQVSKGDTPVGTVEYHTLFAVALILFLFTFSMNILANRIQRRFREEYKS